VLREPLPDCAKRTTHDSAAEQDSEPKRGSVGLFPIQEL